jgi:NAD(P)-dependent dehydrogenase (short-subunit alcohol dehydrogenase family)
LPDVLCRRAVAEIGAPRGDDAVNGRLVARNLLGMARAGEEHEESVAMNISRSVAVVTGAADGIGRAVAREFARRGVKAVALVDGSQQVEEVARSLNAEFERPVSVAMVGDVTDAGFRQEVFDVIAARHGTPTICVPAAGKSREQPAVRVDAYTGCAVIYPLESFRQLVEVNLIAPIYWALETIARVAEQRKGRGLGRWEPEEGVQGTVIFLGSTETTGNAGQIAYASAKAGLEGVEAGLAREALDHGVLCKVIHPDFTRTPLVRALGDDFVKRTILPYLQSSRPSQPDEVAEAVCASINSAGQELAPAVERPAAGRTW